MEVADDEVGVVHHEIDGDRRQEDARDAAEDERPDRADGEIIGAVRRIRPSYIVEIQLNTLTALGTAIASETNMKLARTRGSIPVENMWCAQTPKESTPMASVE